MIKATIKIGSMNLQIEAMDMQEVFKWSGLYNSIPKECDECQSDVFLSHRQTKAQDDYYELKCSNKECGAAASFGQHKTGKTLFWKWDNKMVKYVFDPNKEPTAPRAPKQSAEDLPF